MVNDDGRPLHGWWWWKYMVFMMVNIWLIYGESCIVNGIYQWWIYILWQWGFHSHGGAPSSLDATNETETPIVRNGGWFGGTPMDWKPPFIQVHCQIYGLIIAKERFFGSTQDAMGIQWWPSRSKRRSPRTRMRPGGMCKHGELGDHTKRSLAMGYVPPNS